MSPTPALRPIILPAHQRLVLPNGLTLHLVPRGPLPLVAVRLVMRGGSAWDAKGKEGVADFSARLLRRGAAGKTADELSEAVEFVGASIGGWANEENTVVSLSTPSRHLEAMLGVLADLVLRPDFPQEEIDLARRRTLAQLSTDLDDPGVLADRALTRATWDQHPYGNDSTGSKRSLETLTRADLQAFMRDRIGPRVAHLYLVGEFDARAVRRSVDRLFGDWSGGPAVLAPVPAWKGLRLPGEVVIVNKPEQTQVQVRVGARGVGRGHPDHFPLAVVSTVLGGGFTSRLVTEIRVKRGLSYGAGCGFDMMTGAGTFSVSSFTKTETVGTLLDVALGEVDRMRKSGPLAKEVATVQRYISGLYPSRLETNEAISGVIADVEHYGLPADWIGTFRERISAVTVKEATAAAREHLFSDQRSIVLVGNADALAKKAKRYGPVSVVEPKDLA